MRNATIPTAITMQVTYVNTTVLSLFTDSLNLRTGLSSLFFCAAGAGRSSALFPASYFFMDKRRSVPHLIKLYTVIFFRAVLITVSIFISTDTISLYGMTVFLPNRFRQVMLVSSKNMRLLK